MKPSKQSLIYIGVPALLIVGIYIFCRLTLVELMSYHEQYQLFLLTSDYFTQSVSLPGGLADYISEFLTQYYLKPALGALAIAAVFTLIQILFGKYCTDLVRDKGFRPTIYALSATPSMILLHNMDDENILLSYPVALMLVIAATLTMSALRGVKRGAVYAVAVLIVFTVLYWLCGPVALLFVALAFIAQKSIKLRWLWCILTLSASCLMIWLCGELLLTQYPDNQLFFGINYCRITNVHPVSLLVAPLAMLIIALIAASNLNIRENNSLTIATASFAVIIIAGVIYIPSGFDDEKMEIFRYDYLVRNGKWQPIIEEAEKEAPANDFCLQALNLALAQTGQLGDRMFDFDQNGINSLIGRYERNNTTCLITAETFYHLGMINSAFRYNFDLQEAIMNDRKSGRFMKRMAECLIINGHYKMAAKYINKLKNSLYYSKWAKNAEAYFTDKDRTDDVPEWRLKRQQRFKREMLYDYTEIEKILGLLAIESNGQNQMAWDYFIAALLLKGDLPTMTGMYHYANEIFNHTSIPKNHQEAIAMYWTFGHQNFDGIPYPISETVKNSIANIARGLSQGQNQTGQLRKQFGGNYCLYFIDQQMKQANNSAPTIKGSERGD